MSLDKAIEHKKEHRKPYRGNKRVYPMCRNHKGCSWCEENRTYNSRRKIIYMDDLSKDCDTKYDYEKMYEISSLYNVDIDVAIELLKNAIEGRVSNKK